MSLEQAIMFLEGILLIFLIACAISVSLTQKVISAVIIFMSYSIVLSILWLLMQAPDLALTEAAVGAGITSVLFFLVVKRINAIEEEQNDE